MPRQRSYRESLDAISGLELDEEKVGGLAPPVPLAPEALPVEASGAPEPLELKAPVAASWDFAPPPKLEAFSRELEQARRGAGRTRRAAGILQAADDFASALSGGAYRGTDVAGPMREEAKRREEAPFQALQRRAGLAKMGAELGRTDPSSEASRTARELLRAAAPNIAERMGERFERLSADEVTRIFPQVDEYLKVEDAKRKRYDETVAANQRRANLVEVMRKEHPQTAASYGARLDELDQNTLEKLLAGEQAKAGRESTQTFQATQNELNRANALAVGGIAEAGKRAEVERTRADKLRGLMGPGEAVPKVGRMPSEQEAQKFADSATMLEDMRRQLDTVLEYVRRYTPQEILSDPNLRGTLEPIITDLQLQGKGQALYQLGVLTGPDMGLLETVFPKASSLSTVLASLFDQATTGPRLEEARRRMDQRLSMAKERYGFTSPGDPDYEAARRAFDAQANPSSQTVMVYDVEPGSPTYGQGRAVPADRARAMATDPRFSLTPPRR